MTNFFTENADLQFHLEHLDLEEVVALMEDDYQQAKEYAYAPADYQDAVDNYRKVLEMIGAIAGDFIAPRAADVDREGALLKDGKVTYAQGTREALKHLSQAEVMGMTLPRKYSGLNFPITVYAMTVELISRADASLMNIYGLQDIAETIKKYGDDAQREAFLPLLASGESTGAMVLTEPDAGSDLQAVKLQASEDDAGQWTLRGVKRFITNGCGDVLLVLARSEPGTKDGRGLSLFVCRGDETVTVRRIENKLGIHGSPTCELQFNDTPAELVGARKFGLIRYVMDLMNGARLGVAAQALGISQAAYEEAHRYAGARRQFGRPIREIPVVANMLIDMRVALESNRVLLYAAAKWVDIRNQLDERVTKLKAEKQPFKKERERAKEASQVAGLLTAITKYLLTESANEITYDALQIHGGAGYMKEFSIERLARDARVTSIYEGTSQMQIVAAAGGITKDVLADYFTAHAAKPYNGPLAALAAQLKEMGEIFQKSRAYVEEKNDQALAGVVAKELVEMYGFMYVGYLLLDATQTEPCKLPIARRYITSALAKSRMHSEVILSDYFADLASAEELLN